jgi:hypothetical protein
MEMRERLAAAAKAATGPLVLDNMPEFMEPPEAAEVLRTTVSTLAQDRYLGRGVPYHRAGRRILYAKEDVRAYLAAGRVIPQEAGA